MYEVNLQDPEHNHDPERVGTTKTTREQRRAFKRLKSSCFVASNITPPKKKRK